MIAAHLVFNTTIVEMECMTVLQQRELSVQQWPRHPPSTKNAWWGGGCTHAMHGHSRMTIDPCIPTMPGRSSLSFHRPGRHCLYQARSAESRSASCMKGELHPSGGAGGGVLDLMHGRARSRITIDPRIRTTPGRSISGFHRPARHCFHQARSSAGCPASRMKGALRPTKNRM